MYRVYLDDTIIHNPLAPAQSYKFCEEMVVSQSTSWEIDQFTFKMSPKHPNYDDVHVLRSYVKVMDDHGELFFGRVIRIDKESDKTITVTCESRVAFLADTVFEPIYTKKNSKYTSPPEADTVEGWLSFWLETGDTAHNKRIEDDRRKFYVGNIDGARSTLIQTQEPTTIFDLCKKLLENIGGYLVVRVGDDGKQYLDYKTDFKNADGSQKQSTQKVQFGKNMLDISTYINGDSFYTCLYPVGKLLDDNNNQHEGWQQRRTILMQGVSDTRYVRNETLEAIYGKIIATMVFDEIDDPVTLKNIAQGYVNSQALKVSATITAFDLSLVNSDIDRINVGEYVNAISKPLEFNAWLLCKSKETNLSHPEKSTVTLGATQATISRASAGWKD